MSKAGKKLMFWLWLAVAVVLALCGCDTMAAVASGLALGILVI